MIDILIKKIMIDTIEIWIYSKLRTKRPKSQIDSRYNKRLKSQIDSTALNQWISSESLCTYHE
jgi:hypothetical protein